ncbi:MAG: translation initiation factor eIF-2B subunit, partial [Patescibacteria group bacterium]
ASQVAVAFVLLVKKLTFKIQEELIHKIIRGRREILEIRPTEPQVLNFSRLLINELRKKTCVHPQTLIKEVNKLISDYRRLENIIVKKGAGLLKPGENIFTHCHSSLVEKIFVEAKNRKKRFHVYNSETRPLFQGRITSNNLVKNQIKVTQVCDSAAAFFISDHSGDDIRINKVFLGADVVGLNGWAVNKIGSFGLALAAWESKIPLYVAASLLKIDTLSKKRITIPLEKRDSSEIWPEAPKGLSLENYAFDYIPSKFITGFITEFGLIKPKDIAKTVKKYYPDLFKRYV